jgi:hypothetical protein
MNNTTPQVANDSFISSLLRSVNPNRINKDEVDQLARKLVQARLPAITNPQEGRLSRKRLKSLLESEMINKIVLQDQIDQLTELVSAFQSELDFIWKPKFDAIVASIGSLSTALDATYIYTATWFQNCPASVGLKREFCGNLHAATITYGQSSILWTNAANLSNATVADLISFNPKGE